MDGLTGKIKFDQRGQRTDFELDIIELKRDGLTKVGKKYSCVLFKVLEKMVFITIPGRHLDGETWCEYEQELQRDVHRDSGESPEQDAGGDHHHGQSTQIITVYAYLNYLLCHFHFGQFVLFSTLLKLE